MNVNSQVITFSINPTWKNVNQFVLYFCIFHCKVLLAAPLLACDFLTNEGWAWSLIPLLTQDQSDVARKNFLAKDDQASVLIIVTVMETSLCGNCIMWKKIFLNSNILALSFLITAHLGCKYLDAMPVHWYPTWGKVSGKAAFSTFCISEVQRSDGEGCAEVAELSVLAELAVNGTAGSQLCSYNWFSRALLPADTIAPRELSCFSSW